MIKLIIHRIVTLGFVLFAGSMAATSCAKDNPVQTLCDPGSEVFCRCRGGDESSTKTCNADGTGFGECFCEGSSSGSGSGGGQDVPPGDGPKPNPGELLAACTSDTECETGHCPMGFCTKGCATYEDCAPPEPAEPGDCISFSGVDLGSAGICVPYCLEQSDCADYGQNSKCSFTTDSLPAYEIVVCADWPDVTLPPDGYPPDGLVCLDDIVCNLGANGTERVCDAGGDCAAGCNDEPDCPMGVTCSNGACGGGPPPPPGQGDDCPGITVNLAMGQTVNRNDDTSTVPVPDEHNGTNMMMPAQNCSFGASGEEIVYAVTNTTNTPGYLTVDLTISNTSSYDPALYVRAGSCASGVQLECSDSVGAGNGEIIQTYVWDTETVWVFVDGFNSSGSYQISFNLDLNP